MRSFSFQLIAGFSILLLASPLGQAQAASHTPAAPQKKAAPAPAAKPKPSYYLCRIDLTPTRGGLTADAVIPLLKNTDPFTLQARDSSSLLVYTSNKVKPGDTCPDDLKKRVQDIANGNLTGKEVIRVVHGRAIGDIVKAVKALIPDKTDITVTPAGGEYIQVVRGASVSDADYNGFKEAVERLEWQMKNESPTARVFYVNASDVSQAVGGKGAAKTGGSDSSDKSGGSQTQTGTTTTINQVCLPQGAAAAPAKPAATAAAGGGNSPDSASDASGKSAQAATPCTVAPSAAKSDTSGSATDQSASSLSVASVNDDLLVFNAAPGHDGDISEKKRLLATLDFPRPEVLLNIWSFQASSSRGDEVAQRARALHRMIDAFNDAIQVSIDRTWNDLQSAIQSSGGYDPDVYPYLTQQYVGNYENPGTSGSPLFVPDPERTNLGLCQSTHYCLGYSSLLNPAKPTLTDMLLAVILSKQPATTMSKAIDSMQGTGGSRAAFDADSDASSVACDAADRYEITANVKLQDFLVDADGSDGSPGKQAKSTPSTIVFPLHCFEAEAHRQFIRYKSANGLAPRVSVLRAALVNFLFHYKMSQQYPHEFSVYDLNQSAQELNSELNPLIVAFNRDVSQLLDVFSHASDKTETKNGWWLFGGHDTTFINNGVITVRTLSGKATTVDAVTQSVFDATNPPSITDLINSVGEAEKNVPDVLKTNLTANEAAAIIGALNSVTPAQSQIGREFKINITPRSLSGASSSELQVNLDAKESAEPTLYSKGNKSSDNISRVADHSVDTKVRLESIKLFEVSSFSAYLERSRKNFPILPPVFELPYIGSILSLPLPGAKEYHRSTAVISAIVVPTAIDIVSGIRFNFDRVVAPLEMNTGQGAKVSKCSTTSGAAIADKPCVVRVALSISDLSPYSISAYHRAKLACIATGAASPYPGSALQCGDRLQLSSFFSEY